MRLKYKAKKKMKPNLNKLTKKMMKVYMPHGLPIVTKSR